MRVLLSTDTDSPKVLQQLLDWLVDLNIVYLLQHPESPALYKSGVKYRREPRQVVRYEKFCGIGEILEQGWGDCDDLVPYRVAELQLIGMKAIPLLIDATHPKYKEVSRGRGKRQWHCVVAREIPGMDELVIEDPSARLGMYDV